MKKKSIILSKGLTYLLASSMILSTAPVSPVFAEEDYGYEEDGEYYDDGIVEDDEFEEADFDVDSSDVVSSSVFMIKEFKKFEKQDGKFIDPETSEKYGKLKAKEGTAKDKLGLPKDITVIGYWDGSDPDATFEMELKDISWCLDKDKYEDWEFYDEASPADTYTFTPDYEDYLFTAGDLEDIKLAEGVKNLKIDVVIEAEEAVKETEEDIEEAELVESFEDDAELSDEPGLSDMDDESDSEDGTMIFGGEEEDDEDELTNIFGTFDEDNQEEDTEKDGIIVGSSDTDVDDEDELTNIFAGLNDDAIKVTVTEDNDSEEFEDDGVIEVVDGDSDEDSELDDDTDIDDADSENDDTDSDNDDTDDSDIDDPDIDDPDIDESVELTGVLSLELPDGTVVYTDTKKTTLSTEQENDIYLKDIFCGTSLKNLSLVMDDSIVLGDELDLKSGDETVFLYTDDDDNEFQINLTVKQNAHAWSESSCTEPSYCLNCGKQGKTASHTPAGEATCSENDYCLVCYEEIPDTALGHDWKAATCKNPKTCKRCGATKGKKLGHVDAGDATCTENATCERCGKEIAGTALGHSWKRATCTKPKTCKRCGASKGQPLGHDFGDWMIIENSTNNSHGIERRYCQRDNCEKYEEARLNIIASPEYNSIVGIKQGADYPLKSRIAFTASGSGMTNKEPIKGDVRYVPSTWNIQGTPGTFMNGYEGAFTISKAGNYTLTTSFQKQIYNGHEWTSTDIADSRSVSFTVGGSATSEAGSNTAVHINPQTGDSTPIVPIVGALVAALAGIIAAIVMKIRK